MNQTKIGTFIAKCRKDKKLTQAQLAEKLNITDRAVFNRIGKSRKSFAFGIAFLSVIPFELIINAVLSKILSDPIFNIWDMLSIFCLLICAAVSFAYGYAAKKRLDKHTKSMLRRQSSSGEK